MGDEHPSRISNNNPISVTGSIRPNNEGPTPSKHIMSPNGFNEFSPGIAEDPM